MMVGMSAEQVFAPKEAYHDCRDGMIKYPDKSQIGRIDRCECGRYWRVSFRPHWFPFDMDPKWRRISTRKAKALIARSRHGEPA